MSPQVTQHYRNAPKFKIITLLLSYCLQRVAVLSLQLSCVLCLLKAKSYHSIDNLMSRNLIVPCL